MPSNTEQDSLHGAVPLELSWIEPDEETGKPVHKEETKYLYYNNQSVDKFQRESGIELSDLSETELPDDFPHKRKLSKAGVETLGTLSRTSDKQLQQRGLNQNEVKQARKALEGAEGFEARVDALLEHNDISRLRFTSILLWSALLWADPDLTIDEVARMTSAKDLSRIYEKVGKAFRAYAGQEEEEDDDTGKKAQAGEAAPNR